ncbi:GNAT family N-acetyltransferase [Oceanirhabdus sp. W0125-5]|uniref:GNAT family N-acetyltransferase n=1 Tax=Oceanirhabdus sp. W0125-5 TaxID=2999116 RepID=UPI0022F2D417|nr:GNAT family N-acetyltransferase [Oceanirhabdus sp. W0125-5]WBW96399.1 GNAT family N-acetyltransferase [Oceanirhabdus sp. W0125-5]
MFGNIEIRPFCNNDLYAFTEMFISYFRDDFNFKITDEKAEKLCSRIGQESKSGITLLDMLLLDGKMVGFISYQIDTPNSDWCEREGWGFIREIYVDKNLRGKGLGQKLVVHAEKNLYANGVEHVYLTSDESGQFWNKCGYKDAGKISEINNDPIYEK